MKTSEISGDKIEKAREVKLARDLNGKIINEGVKHHLYVDVPSEIENKLSIYTWRLEI